MVAGELKIPKNTTDNTKKFLSTSIHLSAALLTQIEEACFVGFSVASVDGKKIIEIEVPKTAESKAQNIVSKFNEKSLTVGLYEYNRNLNFLRDKLFSGEKVRDGNQKDNS